MGVLTKFLRAPDAATVVRALREEAEWYARLATTGQAPDGAGPSRLARIDATGMQEADVLAELDAAVRKVPATDDVVWQSTVWPTDPPPGPEDLEDENSPWVTGPWVTQCGDDFRDGLATLGETDLPGVLARWQDTDAVRRFGADSDVLLDALGRFTTFARAAQADGHRLFCWISL